MINDALAALADPTRRQIFELVAEAPGPVGKLADRLPVSRPAVSQHLKVLREAALVQEQRVGTRHIYSVDPRGIAALHSYLDRFWMKSLNAFKEAAEADSLDHRSPPHRPDRDSTNRRR